MKKTIVMMLLLMIAAVPFVAAETAREKLQQRVDNYNEARITYLAVRENYTEARGEFLKARQGFLNRTVNDTKIIEKSKDFLLATIDRAVSHLQTIESWVQKSSIDPAKQDEMIAGLESHISDLEALKSDVDAIQTKQDARNVAAKIKAVWKEARLDVKRFVGQAIGERARKVSDAMSNLSDRLHAKVNELKDAGEDTSKIESLLADYDAKIASAEQKRSDAVEKIGSGDESAVAEGRKLMAESNNELKEAHKILRQILEQIKSFNKADVSEQVSEAVNETSQEVAEE